VRPRGKRAQKSGEKALPTTSAPHHPTRADMRRCRWATRLKEAGETRHTTNQPPGRGWSTRGRKKQKTKEKYTAYVLSTCHIPHQDPSRPCPIALSRSASSKRPTHFPVPSCLSLSLLNSRPESWDGQTKLIDNKRPDWVSVLYRTGAWWSWAAHSPLPRRARAYKQEVGSALSSHLGSFISSSSIEISVEPSLPRQNPDSLHPLVAVKRGVGATGSRTESPD